MKKILSICLSIIIVLSIGFVDGFNIRAAAKSEDSLDYEYAVISESDKTASLTSYNGIGTDLVIPATIDGYKIVEIGYGFCEENEELRSVIISDGIIDIGAYAFNRCPRLKDITIPPSVKRMGYNAFGQNDIRYENGSVNISDLYAWCNIDFSGYSIYNMFWNKNLYLNGSLVEDLVIPDGIVKIKDNSFTYCKSFNSVYFPDSVETIEEGAFARTDISNIYVNSVGDFLQIKCEGSYFNFGDTAWNLVANGELVADLVIAEGTQTISDRLFSSCKSLQTIHIPGSIKRLGSEFLYCDNLTEVYIEDGVEEINFSFYQCGNNTSDFTVFIPSSVSYIERQAFDTNAKVTIIECMENSYAHRYAETISQDTDLWWLDLEYHVFDAECDPDCNLCEYNRKPTDEHIFDTECDPDCNLCGFIRQTEHIYSYNCDNNCDKCGAIRNVEHTYSNENDLTCDICFESLTPEAPIAQNVYATSITLKTVSGCEYSIDGTNWQDSGIFNELTPEEEYTFYQRIKETSSSKQSGISEPLVIKTPTGYKITLCYNDGSGSEIILTKTHGVPIDLGSISKEDHNFLGWAQAPNGEDLIDSYSDDAQAVFYAKWKLKCYMCSARGYTYKTVTEYTTCSSCFGRGTTTQKDTTHMRCINCGSTSYTTEFVPASPGGFGEKRICNMCGSHNVGKGYTETVVCYSCDGDGKRWETTSKIVDCTYCSGGSRLVPQPTAPQPKIKTIGENFVELVSVDGAEYSLDGANWQSSSAFYDLSKDRSYCFYQRYKANSISSVGEASEGLVFSFTANIETKAHKYDNACDKTCNVCGATRTVPSHVYTNACDTDCNVCGAKRTVTHTYSTAYDAVCDVCGHIRESVIRPSLGSTKHTVTDTTVGKITAGLTIESLLVNLDGGENCKVYNGSTVVDGKTKVGTGMTVKIMDGATTVKAYTAVVTGDTNGDGNITVTDMIAIKAHVLKKTFLTDASKTAADTNGDNGISITDFIQIKAKILGKGTITAR